MTIPFAEGSSLPDLWHVWRVHFPTMVLIYDLMQDGERIESLDKKTRFTRHRTLTMVAMVRRAVSLGLLALTCCRRPAPAPPPTPLPEATAGDMDADAGFSKGAWNIDFDTRGSFQIDVAARTARACIVGIHVRGTRASEGCTLGISTIDLAKAEGQLQIRCVGKDSQSQAASNVKLVCTFTNEATNVTLQASDSLVQVKEIRHAPLGPLITPADRAVLEKPITFAKMSAALTDEMNALVVQKAKILETNATFLCWVTGTAEDFPKEMPNIELSEKRSEAVMRILAGRIIDKKRFNRFSVGSSTHRGSGVFFEIRDPS